jgi:hypothetical protein
MDMLASQKLVDCLAWTTQIRENAGLSISIPQYLAGIASCPPELHQKICGDVGNASLSAIIPADSTILLRDGYTVQPRSNIWDSERRYMQISQEYPFTSTKALTGYSGGLAMPFESL